MDTATPTPTPRWGWETPTPMMLPTPEDQLIIDPSVRDNLFIDIAEMGVQTFEIANRDSAIDNISWILTVAIVMLAIRDIHNRIKNL